jgi:hypothetical protein
MSEVKVSRIINTSASQVWNVIGDINNAHIYHPFLQSVDQLGTVDRGVGAIRQCNLHNKTSQIEEVIEWKEGESFTVEAKDAPIIGVVRGGMRVKSVGVNSTEVTVDMRYIPKWGVFGKILNVVIFKILFKYILNRVLKSLKRHMEMDTFREENNEKAI